MTIKIDQERFEIAHELFLQHMHTEGIPFTSFDHPLLVRDEILYKWEVYNRGYDAINLGKWPKWKKSPGKIISALKLACRPSISANLLEHRYGPMSYSESALYKVKGGQQIKELENSLFTLFLGGSSEPSELGPRFDSLANHLRVNHLGCKWPFMAYLCFLLNPQLYFPILPGRFDMLLRFYKVGYLFQATFLGEAIASCLNWRTHLNPNSQGMDRSLQCKSNRICGSFRV
jgi:hypothetical protein